MNETWKTIYPIVGFLWNILIFTTFTYLIFYKGQSGWWYLFMIMIGSSCNPDRRPNEED
jgi:hypothetical protein